MVYGYSRRKKSALVIKKDYPDAEVLDERGGSSSEWERILFYLRKGDILVFESVLYMGDNEDAFIEAYFELISRGVQLIFIKEHFIDTDIYRDIYHDTCRAFMERQLRSVYSRVREVAEDRSRRSKESIKKAKSEGKQVGQKTGVSLKIKKSEQAKRFILEHSRDFGGVMNDVECMQAAHVSRMTFYKYKRELKEDPNALPGQTNIYDFME